MFRRAGIKPSKAASGLTAVVGAGMTIFGIIALIAIGHPFLILWTLVAAGITAYHLINVFSDQAPPLEEVHFERDNERRPDEPTADRLRRLEQLRAENLITEDEHDRKRAEILRGL